MDFFSSRVSSRGNASPPAPQQGAETGHTADTLPVGAPGAPGATGSRSRIGLLLPGLALSKAMRDLLEGNLISGNSKVVEVLLIACSIAAGVAVALTLFQMTE